MERITIYPKDERQKSLLKAVLEEMKIRFEIGISENQTLLSESEFLAKVDKSIAQVESGQTVKLSKEEQKQFLGL